MLMTLAPVFGVLAGVVGVVDTIPYVRDIVRGSTRPHRGTWFIWGVLAIVECVSHGAGGALAAGAVGAVDASLLCYPIYYCLVNWAIALLIHQRRALVLPAPAPSA